MEGFQSCLERPITQNILNRAKQLRRKLIKQPLKQHKSHRSSFEPVDINKMRYVVSPKSSFGNISPNLTSLKSKMNSQSSIFFDDQFLNRLLPKETIRNLALKPRKNIHLLPLFQSPQVRMKTDWINSKYRLF